MKKIQIIKNSVLLIFIASLGWSQNPYIYWEDISTSTDATWGRSITKGIKPQGIEILTRQNFNNSNRYRFILENFDIYGHQKGSSVYGDPNFSYSGRDVILSSGGSYIVVGTKLTYNTSPTNWDFFLRKHNPKDASKSFTKNYDFSSYDVCFSVAELDDGGFILGGYKDRPSSGYIIRTDDLGEIIWQNQFERNVLFGIYSIIINDNQEIIGIGSALGSDGKYDIALLKMAVDGQVLWTKRFDNPDYDQGKDITACSDGSYLATGPTHSSTDDYSEIWLLKFDESGDTLWTKRLGRPNREDSPVKVIETSDGNYLIAGYTPNLTNWGVYDGWLIKTDANGDSIWSHIFHFEDDCYLDDVVEVSDSLYIVVGAVRNNQTNRLMRYIACIGENDQVLNIANKTPFQQPGLFFLSQNYPNPFNPSTTISYALPVASNVSVDIYNILGQRVKVLEEAKKPAGFHTVQWNATDFSSGIYFVKIQCQHSGMGVVFTDLKKMILVK